ncbi:MAG: MATE family efflux transporter, partial [Ruminococcus sp.]
MKKIIAKDKNVIIGKMLRNAALGIILMEISGAVTYIIDGIITSRFLGDSALAATGIASVSYTILAIISGIISAGGQKICCSEIGSGKKQQANNTFSMVIFITAVISIIVSVLGIIFSGSLAGLMGAKASYTSLYNNTTDYIRGFFIGAPGHIFVAVLIPLAQLNGSNKLITASIVTLTIGDILGDIINVTVLKWGLFGMGLATSISYYLSAVVLILSFI